MAGPSPLKTLFDTHVRPLMAKLAGEVQRMRVINTTLVQLREALCRPESAASRSDTAADADRCRTTIQAYSIWCRRRGASPTRSLTRLLLIAMSSSTGRADPLLGELLDKTHFSPPSSPTPPADQEDRDAA